MGPKNKGTGPKSLRPISLQNNFSKIFDSILSNRATFMNKSFIDEKNWAYQKDKSAEKLVKKLGYPKEVLDFEYDHEVRNIYT